jgi:hypothetical protein
MLPSTPEKMKNKSLDQNREEEIKEEKKWVGRNQSRGMLD